MRKISIIFAYTMVVMMLITGCKTKQSNTKPTAQATTLKPNVSSSPSPTQSPKVLPTPVMQDDSLADITLLDKDSKVVSLNWSGTGFGIANPGVSYADKYCEKGSGLTVCLPDTSAWCQYFTVTGGIASAFKAYNGQKYIRLWICNLSGGDIGIGIALKGENAKAVLCTDNALAYRVTREQEDCVIGDLSGMGAGENSSISVPNRFCGWVSFPVAELVREREQPLLTDIKKVTEINIDIRPVNFYDGGCYILNNIVFTDCKFGSIAQMELPDDEGSGADKKAEEIMNRYVKLLDAEPNVKYMTDFDPTGVFSGIKAITYDGMDIGDKKTKVFAYIGVPEDNKAKLSNGKIPAIVLLHGGGGHAFLEWVKMWMDRGYAAIAMDNTGYFPTQVNAGNTEVSPAWEFGLNGIFKEEGYVNAPNNDNMGSSNGSFDNMWMYHAVADSIIAANILRSDSRIDSGSIGITGISWGGVITSLAIGFDTRFAFAIPIYGSGYLDEAFSFMGDSFSGEATQKLWSAADRFGKVNMPVLWLCWNDDNCFSVNSNSKSYLDTVKNNSKTLLSMKNLMYHSHASGWAPAESMLFADSVIRGSVSFTALKNEPSGRSINVELDIDNRSGKTEATLYYLTDKITYSKQTRYGYESTFKDQIWKTASLTVKSGKVTGSVPNDAVLYYIEIKTDIGGHSSITCSSVVNLQ